MVCCTNYLSNTYDVRVTKNHFFHLCSESLSSINVGLLFQIKDESRPNRAQDYSLTIPMRHVAPGLSLHYTPQISDCQKQYSSCNGCMNNYFNSNEGKYE